MRTQFLQVTTRSQAIKSAPWALAIIKVCGGFQAFESKADYKTWKKQR